MESTRRSSRSICSTVPRCHAARVWRRAGSLENRPSSWRLLGEEVRVGTDHGERRPELVGDEGDQLVAGLVEGLELGDLGLGLALEPALLEDPRQQVRDGGQLRDVLVGEPRGAPRSGR